MLILANMLIFYKESNMGDFIKMVAAGIIVVVSSNLILNNMDKITDKMKDLKDKVSS